MADVTAYANASTTPGTNASINSISILGTGLLSTADDSFRNSIALAAKFYSDITAQDTVGGTGDTITVTTPTLYTAYAPIRLLFTASAANTTAVTLNLDGLGAKAVRKISGGTDVALIAGDIPAGARVDVVYSAAANSAAGGWIIIGSSAGLPAATNAQAATATSTAVALTPANLAQERGYSNASFSNLSIVADANVSTANALTVRIKGQDGNDPSATNPVYVSFRSATLTSGANAQLTLTAATSIVISSGSTMGFSSTIIGKLWLVGFNDAGTFRLGLVNARSSTSIMVLRDGIYSSTAEGGAGAADSPQVIYTGTAVTSKAMTILGYLEATEATAGTWATAPSLVQVRTPNTTLPGDQVQTSRTSSGSGASGTTQIPVDTTIPQITEGDQYFAIAITPQSAANIFRVTSQVMVSVSIVNFASMALFRDATANALAASIIYNPASNGSIEMTLNHELLAEGTASTTMRIRIGPGAAGTVAINNANGSGPILGGVANSFLQVQEIVA